MVQSNILGTPAQIPQFLISLYSKRSGIPKTYKPECYWLGEAEFVSEKEGIYTYMLTIPAPRGKDDCPWWQVGWCYLLKGYDTPIFIKKSEQCLSLDHRWITYRDSYHTIKRKTIFFEVPFEINDGMYIAPLNQYILEVTNEEVIEELNSYWPKTFNTYEG